MPHSCLIDSKSGGTDGTACSFCRPKPAVEIKTAERKIIIFFISCYAPAIPKTFPLAPGEVAPGREQIIQNKMGGPGAIASDVLGGRCESFH
ncbi:MAG: hypothetical protein CVU77_06485 [Elusimicrobia bacterium HGW-Elusimicrobia-1]|nr:MAG: hypothetical protein CVU77_06485 [Elusimicrobia bacterium HGW-Elusimicrobia-1]